MSSVLWAVSFLKASSVRRNVHESSIYMFSPLRNPRFGHFQLTINYPYTVTFIFLLLPFPLPLLLVSFFQTFRALSHTFSDLCHEYTPCTFSFSSLSAFYLLLRPPTNFRSVPTLPFFLLVFKSLIGLISAQ